MSNFDYNIGYLPPSAPSSFLSRYMRFKSLFILALIAFTVTYFVYQEDDSSSVATTMTTKIKTSQTENEETFQDLVSAVEGYAQISQPSTPVQLSPTVTLATTDLKQENIKSEDKKPRLVNQTTENLEVIYDAELDALLSSGDLLESFK